MMESEDIRWDQIYLVGNRGEFVEQTVRGSTISDFLDTYAKKKRVERASLSVLQEQEPGAELKDGSRTLV